MASQITSLTIVYSTVHSGADQRKHQSSASLAFVWGIHRPPVNSPQKWPVTQKMFPFDDVIMKTKIIVCPYKHIDHVWRNSQLDHTIQFIFSNYKTVSWDIIPYTETQIHICLRALKVPPLFSVNILLDHHRFGIAQRSSADIITHNFRLVIQILMNLHYHHHHHHHHQPPQTIHHHHHHHHPKTVKIWGDDIAVTL